MWECSANNVTFHEPLPCQCATAGLCHACLFDWMLTDVHEDLFVAVLKFV